MKGNEAGMGDPIEDAVSVGTIAFLDDPKIIFKSLICIGLGADRFNDVSDCSSLRAIAEITKLGGFNGSVSLEKESKAFRFYQKCLEHIYQRQSFRSVLSGSIVAAIQGYFGREVIPDLMGNRVQQGTLFTWPLMAILWSFDPYIIAERSLTIKWIKNCSTARECNNIYSKHREELKSIKEILEVEELPRHIDYSIRHNDSYSFN